MKGTKASGSTAMTPTRLNGSMTALHDLVPHDGTSLENAFDVIKTLVPAPDRVILITDGLPTQGPSPPLIRKTIDGDGRMRLFEHAIAKYPKGVPLSVIPVADGRRAAGGECFWVVSRRSGGEFLEPAKDLAVRFHG
jgi:hypothetical protein